MRWSNRTQGWLWVLGGGLAACLMNPVWATEPPAAADAGKQAEQKAADPLLPFTISKETTRITEPLKPDGSVDYAAALNARLSQGVTPANNAAALLMQAIGADAVPEAQRKKFFQTLGIAAPSGKGSLQNIAQFAKEQNQQKAFDQQSEAMQHPWSRKDLPMVADWLDANADAIKIVIEASKRPRFFVPFASEDDDPLLNTPLELTTSMRVFYRLLNARAMLALGDGRIEDAQNDLLACHRLARLLGQQPTMLETLVSYALDAVACQGDHEFAQSEKVTGLQLGAYRQKLAELPPLPKMSEKLDKGERLVSLDAICNLATQKTDGGALGVPNNQAWKRMLGLTINWDLILKQFNEEYDQIVAALQLTDFSARQAQMSKLETELKKLQAEANQPAQIALILLGVDPPRAVVSRQIGNVLLGLLMPAIRQASTAEVRAETRRDMTLVALAIGEYHRDEGRYPEKLADLSPEYFKTIPQDGFTNKPLQYQPQKDGYLLYSVGANGKDDQGQRASAAHPNADDLALCVPSEPEL